MRSDDYDHPDDCCWRCLVMVFIVATGDARDHHEDRCWRRCGYVVMIMAFVFLLNT